MLTVQHLTIHHARDLRPLIRDLSFTLSGTERLAVIGEEGDGKSTLLQAIACPEKLEDWAEMTGSIRLNGEKLGYLAQETPDLEGLTAYDYCAREEVFSRTEPGRLAELNCLLSLPQDLCWSDTPWRCLSGGERVKLRLLALMAAGPTMLALDEPGNDLDLEALEALERFLLNCRLPVIYVSHDEHLLMRTATAVLHLESVYDRTEPRWTLANIPYAEYVKERAEGLDRQEQQWQMERRQQRERQARFDRIEQAVRYAQENISRGDPHGGRLLKKKMKAVKSLEHRYEREAEAAMERPYTEYRMDAAFEGCAPIPAGRTILDMDLPLLEAGGRILARDLRILLRGSEKLLITGPNGAGKTTLLRLIRETLAEKGGFKVAYMPQRYDDLLPPDQSPAEYLHTDGTKEQLTRIRTTLGAMKLTQDEITHPMKALSGGQRAKVLLLKMMLEAPDVLLLDEPTRNLSPLSAPVMRRLILTFPGAAVCVTHDRLLMEAWTGQRLELGR